MTPNMGSAGGKRVPIKQNEAVTTKYSALLAKDLRGFVHPSPQAPHHSRIEVASPTTSPRHHRIRFMQLSTTGSTSRGRSERKVAKGRRITAREAR